MKCANCGALNEQGDLFCVECGRALPPPAPSSGPQQARRRWLLLLPVLAVFLVLAGLLVAFVFDLLALPPSLTALFERPSNDSTMKSTRQPFVVIAQPGADVADVVAMDLDGTLLAGD